MHQKPFIFAYIHEYMDRLILDRLGLVYVFLIIFVVFSN